MIALYQFQFSHFCEKARWALDYKCLPHVRKNLLPGLHMRVARKLAPRNCLPILVDNGTVVQDSTSIITFLDEKYPDRPLTPRDAREAKEALEWEEYLDDEIGVPLRLWFYTTRFLTAIALSDSCSTEHRGGRRCSRSSAPGSRCHDALMNIHAESARQSENA
jgi:glutathione S-transferase